MYCTYQISPGSLYAIDLDRKLGIMFIFWTVYTSWTSRSKERLNVQEYQYTHEPQISDISTMRPPSRRLWGWVVDTDFALR